MGLLGCCTRPQADAFSADVIYGSGLSKQGTMSVTMSQKGSMTSGGHHQYQCPTSPTSPGRRAGEPGLPSSPGRMACDEFDKSVRAGVSFLLNKPDPAAASSTSFSGCPPQQHTGGMPLEGRSVRHGSAFGRMEGSVRCGSALGRVEGSVRNGSMNLGLQPPRHEPSVRGGTHGLHHPPSPREQFSGSRLEESVRSGTQFLIGSKATHVNAAEGISVRGGSSFFGLGSPQQGAPSGTSASAAALMLVKRDASKASIDSSATAATAPATAPAPSLPLLPTVGAALAALGQKVLHPRSPSATAMGGSGGGGWEPSGHSVGVASRDSTAHASHPFKEFSIKAGMAYHQPIPQLQLAGVPETSLYLTAPSPKGPTTPISGPLPTDRGATDVMVTLAEPSVKNGGQHGHGYGGAYHFHEPSVKRGVLGGLFQKEASVRAGSHYQEPSVRGGTHHHEPSVRAGTHYHEPSVRGGTHHYHAEPSVRGGGLGLAPLGPPEPSVLDDSAAPKDEMEALKAMCMGPEEMQEVLNWDQNPDALDSCCSPEVVAVAAALSRVASTKSMTTDVHSGPFPTLLAHMPMPATAASDPRSHGHKMPSGPLPRLQHQIPEEDDDVVPLIAHMPMPGDGPRSAAEHQDGSATADAATASMMPARELASAMLAKEVSRYASRIQSVNPTGPHSGPAPRSTPEAVAAVAAAAGLVTSGGLGAPPAGQQRPASFCGVRALGVPAGGATGAHASPAPASPVVRSASVSEAVLPAWPLSPTGSTSRPRSRGPSTDGTQGVPRHLLGGIDPSHRGSSTSCLPLMAQGIPESDIFTAPLVAPSSQDLLGPSLAHHHHPHGNMPMPMPMASLGKSSSMRRSGSGSKLADLSQGGVISRSNSGGGAIAPAGAPAAAVHVQRAPSSSTAALAAAVAAAAAADGMAPCSPCSPPPSSAQTGPSECVSAPGSPALQPGGSRRRASKITSLLHTLLHPSDKAGAPAPGAIAAAAKERSVRGGLLGGPQPVVAGIPPMQAHYHNQQDVSVRGGGAGMLRPTSGSMGPRGGVGSPTMPIPVGSRSHGRSPRSLAGSPTAHGGTTTSIMSLLNAMSVPLNIPPPANPASDGLYYDPASQLQQQQQQQAAVLGNAQQQYTAQQQHLMSVASSPPRGLTTAASLSSSLPYAFGSTFGCSVAPGGVNRTPSAASRTQASTASFHRWNSSSNNGGQEDRSTAGSMAGLGYPAMGSSVAISLGGGNLQKCTSLCRVAEVEGWASTATMRDEAEETALGYFKNMKAAQSQARARKSSCSGPLGSSPPSGGQGILMGLGAGPSGAVLTPGQSGATGTGAGFGGINSAHSAANTVSMPPTPSMHNHSLARADHSISSADTATGGHGQRKLTSATSGLSDDQRTSRSSMRTSRSSTISMTAAAQAVLFQGHGQH